MANFTSKRSSWLKIQKHDPSFYQRFSRAWTNFRENEAEARLQGILASPKTRDHNLSGFVPTE